jgi:hypothetical protein
LLQLTTSGIVVTNATVLLTVATSTTTTSQTTSKRLLHLTWLISQCFSLFIGTTTTATTVTTTALVTDMHVITPKELVRFSLFSLKFLIIIHLSGRNVSTTSRHFHSYPIYCYATHSHRWNVCSIYTSEQNVQSKSYSSKKETYGSSETLNWRKIIMTTPTTAL